MNFLLRKLTNGNRGVNKRLNKQCKDDFDHNPYTQYQTGYTEDLYEKTKNAFCGEETDNMFQGSSKSIYGLPYMSTNFRNYLHASGNKQLSEEEKQMFKKEIDAYNILTDLNTENSVLQKKDKQIQLSELHRQFMRNKKIYSLPLTEEDINENKNTQEEYDKAKDNIQNMNKQNDPKRKGIIKELNVRTTPDNETHSYTTHTSMDGGSRKRHTRRTGGSRRRRLRRSRRTGGLRRRSRRN